jgi:hypothetical protein
MTSALPPPENKTPTPAPAASPSIRSNGTPAHGDFSAPSPVNPASSRPESANGSRSTPTASDSTRERQQAKKQQKKERKKEEKERDRADKDSVAKDESEPTELAHEAQPSTSSVPATQNAEPMSPADGGHVTGSRTPTGPPRRQRHPWTLFMKLPGPCTESEVREFFLTAKEGVH